MLPATRPSRVHMIDFRVPSTVRCRAARSRSINPRELAKLATDGGLEELGAFRGPRGWRSGGRRARCRRGAVGRRSDLARRAPLSGSGRPRCRGALNAARPVMRPTAAGVNGSALMRVGIVAALSRGCAVRPFRRRIVHRVTIAQWGRRRFVLHQACARLANSAVPERVGAV